MEENLAQKAIEFALKCNWKESIKINLLILKTDKKDVDSLNRLAKAYFEIGNLKKAISFSKKALKLDPKNDISINTLKKYKNCTNSNLRQDLQSPIDASMFIEETGKTKLINLINLGSSKTISNLSSGNEVVLIVHAHRVTINTLSGEYIGKIADDFAAKLRCLVKGGNSYKIFIKSTDKNGLKVLIRENKKGKDMKNVISFPRDPLESVSEDFTDSNS